mmetsp:Transcript_43953/g.64375  ORF Transcript_43953/g.64375 Transcript_43953/m.64375 type:complete len:81 (-) Transcript_43953:5-247(-)
MTHHTISLLCSTNKICILLFTPHPMHHRPQEESIITFSTSLLGLFTCSFFQSRAQLLHHLLRVLNRTGCWGRRRERLVGL